MKQMYVEIFRDGSAARGLRIPTAVIAMLMLAGSYCASQTGAERWSSGVDTTHGLAGRTSQTSGAGPTGSVPADSSRRDRVDSTGTAGAKGRDGTATQVKPAQPGPIPQTLPGQLPPGFSTSVIGFLLAGPLPPAPIPAPTMSPGIIGPLFGGFFPFGTSLSLSLAQSSASNWLQDDGLTWMVGIGLRSRGEYPIGPFTLRTSLLVKAGATYFDDSVGSAAIRVTDNDLFSEGTLAWPLGLRVDPYLSASVRTAVTESFGYIFGRRMRVASLWDPVISQQSAGFTCNGYGGSGTILARMGVALRQIRAVGNTLLTDDISTLGVVERYRAQSGLEMIGEGSLRRDSTIYYFGRVGLFGSFDDLTVWTVRSENELRIRLWKFVGITLRLDVGYDRNQSIHTQIKESLMLALMHDM